MKYFIISQPKAGTYLATNLLKEFGIDFQGYHFSLKSYQHYNLKNLNDSRINRKKYTVKKNIFQSIDYINDNCVGVGHLEFNLSIADLLKDYKKILLLRDLETSSDSWKAWAKITSKSANSKMIDINFRNKIEEWKLQKDVFTLNFYDMKNSNIEILNNLQIYLFGELRFDSKTAIQSALTKDSLTKVKRD